MSPLVYLISAVSIVCWIMVLIKLFKKEGVGLGILGIICGLYTFIWGWLNHKKQNLTIVMIVWSVAAVVMGITNASMMKDLPY
ncbi:hypothetical protein JW935_14230 [candidate division KSB1 bacterium]|nr:hypothetical protein [candidate division KSB1 bacterium]